MCVIEVPNKKLPHTEFLPALLNCSECFLHILFSAALKAFSTFICICFYIIQHGNLFHNQLFRQFAGYVNVFNCSRRGAIILDVCVFL